MNLMRHCDFISTEPKLYINNKKRYKNLCGGIISLTIVLITSFVSIQMLINYFEFRKVKIIYNEDVNQNPEVNLERYPFIFNLLDGNGNLFENETKIFSYNPLIWKIDYKKIDNKGNPSIQKTALNVTKCNETSYEFKYSDLKDFQDLKNRTYCLDTSTNMTLKGLIGDSKNQNYYMSIKVQKCVNSTINTNNPCYPEEFIDYKLARSNMILYFIDYNINNDNIYSPNVPYLKAVGIPTNSYMVKNIQYFYRNIVYEIDDGLFFQNKQTVNFFVQKEVQTDIGLLDSGVYTFLHVFFSISRIKGLYSVSYDKIINLLANISAIWNILLYLAVLINNFLIEDLYFLFLSQYNKIIDENNMLIGWNKNDHLRFNNLVRRDNVFFKRSNLMSLDNKVHKCGKNKNSESNKKIFKNAIRNNIETEQHKDTIRKNFHNLKPENNISSFNQAEINQNIYFNFDVNNINNNYHKNNKSYNDNTYCPLEKIAENLQLKENREKSKIENNPIIDQNPMNESNCNNNSRHSKNIKLMNKNKMLFVNKSYNYETERKFTNNNLNSNNILANSALIKKSSKIQKNLFINNYKESCEKNSQINASCSLQGYQDLNIKANHIKNSNFEINNKKSPNKILKSNTIIINKISYFNCFYAKINKSLKKKLISYLKRKLNIEEILRKMIEIDKIKFIGFENETLKYMSALPSRLNFDLNESPSLHFPCFKSNNLNNQDHSMDKFNNNEIIYNQDSNNMLLLSLKKFWKLHEFK